MPLSFVKLLLLKEKWLQSFKCFVFRLTFSFHWWRRKFPLMSVWHPSSLFLFISTITLPSLHLVMKQRVLWKLSLLGRSRAHTTSVICESAVLHYIVEGGKKKKILETINKHVQTGLYEVGCFMHKMVIIQHLKLKWKPMASEKSIQRPKVRSRKQAAAAASELF